MGFITAQSSYLNKHWGGILRAGSIYLHIGWDRESWVRLECVSMMWRRVGAWSGNGMINQNAEHWRPRTGPSLGQKHWIRRGTEKRKERWVEIEKGVNTVNICTRLISVKCKEFCNLIYHCGKLCLPFLPHVFKKISKWYPPQMAEIERNCTISTHHKGRIYICIHNTASYSNIFSRRILTILGRCQWWKMAVVDIHAYIEEQSGKGNKVRKYRNSKLKFLMKIRLHWWLNIGAEWASTMSNWLIDACKSYD